MVPAIPLLFHGFDIRLTDFVIFFLFIHSFLIRKTKLQNHQGIENLDKPITIFIVLGFASELKAFYLLNSTDFIWSLKEYIKFLEFASLYFVIKKNIDSLAKFKELVNLLLFFAYVQASSGLILFLSPAGRELLSAYLSSENYTKSSNIGLLADKNILGYYMVPILFISLYKIDQHLKGYYKLMNIIFPVVIIITLSRAAWIGASIGLAGMIILDHRRNTKYLLLFSIILILLLLTQTSTKISSQFNDLVYGLKQDPTYKSGSTSQRLIYYELGIRASLKNPLFGIGQDGFSFVHKLYPGIIGQVNIPFSNYFSAQYHYSQTAHSQYTQVLVDMGIIGFAAFIWLLYSILRYSYKNYNSIDDKYLKNLNMGIIFAFLGWYGTFAGHSSLLYTTNGIQSLFWILCGLVVASRRITETQKLLKT
jgi:O-antigen ligase